MTLSHFINSYSDLISILDEGIYYTHHETALTRRIAGAEHASIPVFDPGGMICFTDIPVEEVNSASLGFKAKYGISVDKDWAVSKGAKQVKYIDERSAEFDGLRASFEQFKPATPERDQDSVAEFVKSQIEELLLSHPDWAVQGGAHHKHVQFLDSIKWWEIGDHSDEREWRIRSDQDYPDVVRNETKNGPERRLPEMQIKFLRMMVAIGVLRPQVARLQISPEACRLLVVPKARLVELQTFVAGTPYRDCPVVEAPS